MLKLDPEPDVALPQSEAGHWRCVWWSFVQVYFRDVEGSASAADRLGPDEFITPFRFATEAMADTFGRRAEADLRQEGWTPDRLRYERAEFFPDYPEP